MGNQPGAVLACGAEGGTCELRKGCRKIIQLDEGYLDPVDALEDDEGDDVVDVGLAPVFLNIYHLNEKWLKANKITKSIFCLGGAFHAGVEVYGTEYTFGVDGIRRHEPKKSEMHVYGETIFMGETNMTAREVVQLVGELSCEWYGDRYDVFDNNCCDFSEQLVLDLVGASLPSWVSNFSRIASVAAAGLENTVEAKQMVHELVQELHFGKVFSDVKAPDSAVVAA